MKLLFYSHTGPGAHNQEVGVASPRAGPPGSCNWLCVPWNPRRGSAASSCPGSEVGGESPESEALLIWAHPVLVSSRLLPPLSEPQFPQM